MQKSQTGVITNVSHIPRLHDEAGSTSWLVEALVERSTSWLDERSTSQLVEPASSCKRGNKQEAAAPISGHYTAVSDTQRF